MNEWIDACLCIYIEKDSNEFLSARKDMLMLSGRTNKPSAAGCTAAKRLHCDGDARELGCYLGMCNKQTRNSLMEFSFKVVQKQSVVFCHFINPLDAESRFLLWVFGLARAERSRSIDLGILANDQPASVAEPEALPDWMVKGNVAFRNQCWHVSMPTPARERQSQKKYGAQQKVQISSTQAKFEPT